MKCNRWNSKIAHLLAKLSQLEHNGASAQQMDDIIEELRQYPLGAVWRIAAAKNQMANFRPHRFDKAETDLNFGVRLRHKVPRYVAFPH